MWGRSKQAGVCNSGGVSHRYLAVLAPWPRTSVSRTMEYKCLLFEPHSLWYFVTIVWTKTDRKYYLLHDTDEEMEAESSWVICQRSPSWQVRKPGSGVLCRAPTLYTSTLCKMQTINNLLHSLLCVFSFRSSRRGPMVWRFLYRAQLSVRGQLCNRRIQYSGPGWGGALRMVPSLSLGDSGWEQSCRFCLCEK